MDVGVGGKGAAGAGAGSSRGDFLWYRQSSASPPCDGGLVFSSKVGRHHTPLRIF